MIGLAERLPGTMVSTVWGWFLFNGHMGNLGLRICVRFPTYADETP